MKMTTIYILRLWYWPTQDPYAFTQFAYASEEAAKLHLKNYVIRHIVATATFTPFDHLKERYNRILQSSKYFSKAGEDSWYFNPEYDGEDEDGNPKVTTDEILDLMEKGFERIGWSLSELKLHDYFAGLGEGAFEYKEGNTDDKCKLKGWC